ncbi:MAG: hypothetical protein ACTHK0_17080 [Ginsengibacter sp.]
MIYFEFSKKEASISGTFLKQELIIFVGLLYIGTSVNSTSANWVNILSL